MGNRSIVRLEDYLASLFKHAMIINTLQWDLMSLVILQQDLHFLSSDTEWNISRITPINLSCIN